MKLLKGNGAKDLACLVSGIADNQKLGRSATLERDHSQDDWYIHNVEIHL